MPSFQLSDAESIKYWKRREVPALLAGLDPAQVPVWDPLAPPQPTPQQCWST